MKLLKFMLLGVGLILLVASCTKVDGCNFEVGVGGILEKVEGGMHKGGTHYIGTLGVHGGYSVFINSNPDINLDDYLGKDITVEGNYIREQTDVDPRLVDVVRVISR